MDTQAQVNSAVNQATQQGSNLQNQEQGEISNAQGSYGQAQGNAQGAYGALTNFNANIPNMGQQYGNYLTNAQSMYGFNPQMLGQANQALSRTDTTLANLPQAIQQQGNYYGTTAGSEANNYANQAGGLNNVLQGQQNAVNSYQNELAVTQNQANQQVQAQQAGLTLQGQDLQSAYTSAVGQMNAAGSLLASLQNTAAQQGNWTAQQIAAYQNALSTYISAQAQASNLNEQTKLAGNAAATASTGLTVTQPTSISLQGTTPKGIPLQGSPNIQGSTSTLQNAGANIQ